MHTCAVYSQGTEGGAICQHRGFNAAPLLHRGGSRVWDWGAKIDGGGLGKWRRTSQMYCTTQSRCRKVRTASFWSVNTSFSVAFASARATASAARARTSGDVIQSSRRTPHPTRGSRASTEESANHSRHCYLSQIVRSWARYIAAKKGGGRPSRRRRGRVLATEAEPVLARWGGGHLSDRHRSRNRTNWALVEVPLAVS